MKIQSNDLSLQFYRYQEEYERKALEVLRSGWYILGREVKAFEEEFASFLGAKHCVGLASGLDALVLSFRILGIGPGDEVIVPANTYIASVMGITINGAIPVFVEPDEYYNIDISKIESKITKKTKAILSVNLYGQACRMDQLKVICKKHKLYLVEDSAQSHGARFNRKYTNHYADISCFSFYPTKNLGCFGDGGAVVTNNDEIAKMFRIYRNYGSEVRYHNKVVGLNSRLDELQAGFLRIKLSHFITITEERAEIAENYLRSIKNESIILPKIAIDATSVWHLFVIRCAQRDILKKYLEGNGIEVLIHYPIPPHLSEAYRYLGYGPGSFPITEGFANESISLPLYNGMTKEEQQYVIDAINRFEVVK